MRRVLKVVVDTNIWIPASSATLSLPVLERGGYGTVALHAVMSPLSNPSAKSGIGSW